MSSRDVPARPHLQAHFERVTGPLHGGFSRDQRTIGTLEAVGGRLPRLAILLSDGFWYRESESVFLECLQFVAFAFAYKADIN